MCACALTFVAGYGVRTLAEGAPTQQPLFYSGMLELDGEPADGVFTVTLTIHNDVAGGDTLCSATGPVEVSAGRFRMDASECADALRATPDTWVAVRFEDVDGTEHAIDGRSKVGAVPYALEADHASAAALADGASGRLAERLEALEARLATVEQASTGTSAFHAIGTAAVDVGEGAVQIAFDTEEYDLQDEYDPSTGVFIPKAAGRYQLSCHLAWRVEEAGSVGIREVGLYINGVEVVYGGHYGDGRSSTREVNAVLPLAVGDRVHCGALQLETGAQTLNPLQRNLSFGGHKLPF